ncbi:helix-turn-helix transcriptional regulator [bacterium]|nr:helix-turn-helix transcriptional regulator [bacterium]
MRNKKTELTKKFGWKVKIERTKQKISQEKLAEMSGLNKNSLGLIERGVTVPSIETANDIAKALGIRLPELIDVDKIEF